MLNLSYQNSAQEINANAPIVPVPELKIEPKEKITHSINVKVTAYDLSVQSTGKAVGHPHYGLTATGYNLAGHTRETARTIAVDPAVIPLNSKVKLTFKDERLKKYNGIYYAKDTGGAIIGNHIDLFMGDTQSNYPSSEAINFGVQSAKLDVLQD